jgi:hypothetical protein
MATRRATGPFARQAYRAGLRSAVDTAALPYGYTVSMWSSGQVLIHFHGTPSLGLVALFAGGALVGFAFLRTAIAGRDAQPARQLTGGPRWARGGGIQALAVAVTLATVAVAGSLLTPALSWAAGGLATVVCYLGVTSLEYAFQARAARDPGDRRAT